MPIDRAPFDVSISPRSIRPHAVRDSPRDLSRSFPPSRTSACGLLALLVLGAWLVTAPIALAQSAQADPAAVRLYSEAERQLQAGDGDGALDTLELLAQRFPTDPTAARALLHRARLLADRGDRRAADLVLDGLIASHPASEEAASAFILQGESAYAEAISSEAIEQARTSFRRVPLLFDFERYPTLTARARARVRSAELGLLLGDREEAISELVLAVEDETPSPWIGRARLVLGRALLEAGEIPAALETLQRLRDDLPTGLDADAARPSPDDSPTSRAADRRAAGRLLAYAGRHLLRPGGSPYTQVKRWPSSGLTLRKPVGVAADAEGQVLVVDDALPLVALLDAEGRPVESLALRDAVRPAFTRSGTPYVIADDQIVLPFDGQRLGFLQPRSGKEAPLKKLRAAVRGPYGEWFLLARGWRSLLAYQSRRQGEELFATLRPEFVDLERDEVGQVYALDEKNDRVVRIGIDRRATETVAQGEWREPVAFALDTLDRLYVLDAGARQIVIFQDGREVDRLGPDLGGGVALRSPEDIAIDDSGRLFVADSKLPFLAVLE